MSDKSCPTRDHADFTCAVATMQRNRTSPAREVLSLKPICISMARHDAVVLYVRPPSGDLSAAAQRGQHLDAPRQRCERASIQLARDRAEASIGGLVREDVGICEARWSLIPQSPSQAPVDTDDLTGHVGSER